MGYNRSNETGTKAQWGWIRAVDFDIVVSRKVETEMETTELAK